MKKTYTVDRLRTTVGCDKKGHANGNKPSFFLPVHVHFNKHGGRIIMAGRDSEASGVPCTSWAIDTGSSYHVCTTAEAFTSPPTPESASGINLDVPGAQGDQSRAPIEGKGDVVLHMEDLNGDVVHVHLVDVLYMPLHPMSVLSPQNVGVAGHQENAKLFMNMADQTCVLQYSDGPARPTISIPFHYCPRVRLYGCSAMWCTCT